MAAYICGVSGRFPENYQIGLRARIWGVEERYKNKIASVSAGDQLFFYVDGKFRSLHEVTRGPFEDRTPLWPEKDGSLFPHRIGISDPLAIGELPLADVAPHISFMRDKQVPTGTLQGPNGVFNDRLTDADVELLQSRFTAPVLSRAEVAPEAARKSVERHTAIFQLYENDLDEQIIKMLIRKGVTPLECGRCVQTGIDVIDLIGTDPQGRLIVVDINRGRAPEDALLQVLRHMSWARQNRPGSREIRGLIVAEAADAALIEFVQEVPNVDIQLFRLTLEFLPPRGSK